MKTTAAAIVVVLSASAAQAQDRKFQIALGSYAVANAADLATTLSALKCGGVMEANPVLAPFASHPVALTAVKGGLTLGTMVLLWKLHKEHPKAAFYLSVAGAAATSVAAVHNARLMRGR